MNNRDFLDYLSELKSNFFLEAEAKPDKMKKFIKDYNDRYTPRVSSTTDGICTLGENVDKWGVELRIYLKDTTGMPKKWTKRVYENKKYRANEFSYRIDDNELVWELFESGYRIGYNS